MLPDGDDAGVVGEGSVDHLGGQRDPGRGEADLGLADRHGDHRLVVVQQLAQLAHGLAGHDHAGHVVGARRQVGVDPGQAVAVGRHAAQDLASLASATCM